MNAPRFQSLQGPSLELAREAVEAAAKVALKQLPALTKLALSTVDGAAVELEGVVRVTTPRLVGGMKAAFDYHAMGTWEDSKPVLSRLEFRRHVEERATDDRPGAEMTAKREQP